MPSNDAKCPKCGAEKSTFAGPLQYECGSYQSVIGGSHVERPVFKLIESSHCKCRQSLADERKKREAAEGERDKAKERVARQADEILYAIYMLDGNVDDADDWPKPRTELIQKMDSHFEVCDFDAIRTLTAQLSAATARAEAAEKELMALRSQVEATGELVRTGKHCRMIEHKTDCCDCGQITAEYDALLAQPQGGSDG